MHMLNDIDFYSSDGGCRQILYCCIIGGLFGGKQNVVVGVIVAPIAIAFDNLSATHVLLEKAIDASIVLSRKFTQS